jgi:hypothetical protein
MNQSFTPVQSSLPISPAIDHGAAATYTHPSDVTDDTRLTTEKKRAILASWISDARAVENAPSLRQLDSGAFVEVDAIPQALDLLDELTPDRRGDCKWLTPSGRRRSVISKWLRRVALPKGFNDNDDDPPPAPAGFGIPFRPKPLAPAHGARLERVPNLACA